MELRILKIVYGDLFDYDAETAQPLIGQVKEFIEEIKKHISQTRD